MFNCCWGEGGGSEKENTKTQPTTTLSSLTLNKLLLFYGADIFPAFFFMKVSKLLLYTFP